MIENGVKDATAGNTKRNGRRLFCVKVERVDSSAIKVFYDHKDSGATTEDLGKVFYEIYRESASTMCLDIGLANVGILILNYNPTLWRTGLLSPKEAIYEIIDTVSIGCRHMCLSVDMPDDLFDEDEEGEGLVASLWRRQVTP